MDNKQLYLTHLQNEFKKYFAINNNISKQTNTKNYINGFMEAGRILGISFDELQAVVTKEQNSSIAKPNDMDKDKYLDIPTFIRNNM